MESPIIPPNHYQCEICGGIFEKGWKDEEASAGQRKNFNEEPKEDDALLCDNCYKEFTARIFN